jgi:hypothetical protein
LRLPSIFVATLKFTSVLFLSQQEDLTLPEWWDAFEVSRMQNERMEKIKQQMTDMKDDVKSQQNDLMEQRNNLEEGINDTLKRLQQMKTPK